MFAAFSILFIILYFIMLIYDDFYDQRVELHHLEVEKQAETDLITKQAYNIKLARFVPLVIFMFIFTLAQALYLGLAVHHDILIFPTVLAIVDFIQSIVRGTIRYKRRPKYANALEKAEANLENVLHNQRKYKAYRVVANVCYILYFGYMIFNSMF